MSTSTISSATTSSVAWSSQTQTRHKSPIDTAASLFNMSKSDLVKELKSGKSLDDVAKTAGVSHDDLVKALKADMPSDLANSDQADEIAEKIATTKGLPKGGPGGPRGPQGPPPPKPDSDSDSSDSDSDTSGIFGSSLSSTQTSTLKQLSDLLGTDSDSLLDELKSGTSLSDLVSQKGISSSALAGVVQDGLLIDAKA